MFRIGTVVALNQEWVNANGGEPPRDFPCGRKAVVVGKTRSFFWSRCIRVRFLDSKSVMSFHESFFRRVHR